MDTGRIYRGQGVWVSISAVLGVPITEIPPRTNHRYVFLATLIETKTQNINYGAVLPRREGCVENSVSLPKTPQARGLTYGNTLV